MEVMRIVKVDCNNVTEPYKMGSPSNDMRFTRNLIWFTMTSDSTVKDSATAVIWPYKSRGKKMENIAFGTPWVLMEVIQIVIKRG